MTLEANGLTGDRPFDHAERLAQYLVSIGKGIPAERWVDGLIRSGIRQAQTAAIDGLI